MELPLEIVFRNMERSDAIEARVREKAQRLERYFDRITRCRVAVEAPHRHQNHGKIYQVGIEIGVPGKRIIVNHVGPDDPALPDPLAAV